MDVRRAGVTAARTKRRIGIGLACAFALTAAGGGAALGKALPRASASAPTPFRFSVPLGKQTPVVVRTLPYAVCALRLAAGTSTLTLVADHAGDVRLQLHSRAGTQTQRAALRCQARGAARTYQLRFRVLTRASKQWPRPLQRSPTPPRGSRVRPALTAAEAESLPESVLLGRGCPYRPERNSPLYPAWFEAVSQAALLLPPKLVSMPGIKHDLNNPISAATATGTSYNWSGYELTGEKGTYSWVHGAWLVPAVSGEDRVSTYSSEWVGLDGDALNGDATINDLMQDGTEQDVTVGIPGLTSATSYYAWSEVLPQEPTEQRMADIPVKAGDPVVVEAWIADQASAPNVVGKYAWFNFENLRNKWVEVIAEELKPGTTFHGSEAEWIMERPKVRGGFPDLSNYVTAGLTNAFAKTSAATVPYSGGINKQITMQNLAGTRTLSEVTSFNNVAMRFSWDAFH